MLVGSAPLLQNSAISSRSGDTERVLVKMHKPTIGTCNTLSLDSL